MQTQETITALQIFEQGLSKSAIKEMAANAVDSVLQDGNPLQVAEALTAMETFIKEVKDSKEYKDYVREEVSKYGKGYVSPSGAKIEQCEVGSRFDFSNCNDPELSVLEDELKELTGKVEERKNFLKTVPASGMDIRVNDELVTVYPPSKTSTSSYKITLAK